MSKDLNVRRYVVINTRFIALHNWPGCNIESVAYLRNKHRHIFHVRMKLKVIHNYRDVEFIQQKIFIDDFIRDNWEDNDLGAMSCEDMAEELMRQFQACYVRVMEDGENGAELITI